MPVKIVAQLDADGFFVAPVEADESPLEPGVFLLPAGSVDAPIPQVPSGKRARWEQGVWVMKPLPVIEPTPTTDPEAPLTPLQQIEALERQTMLPRAVRDFMLIAMETEAAKQGITPEQLRIANPGYRKVKELDEQIAALRALL